jgi:tetratricopeptide (TPR) repeat protein
VTPDVFAAHLLGAAPLAVAAGLRAAGRQLPGGVAAIAAVAGGWFAWPVLNELLAAQDADLLTRAWLRTLLLVAALSPLAAAAASLLPPARRPRPTALGVAAAGLAAAVLPAVAADRAAAAGMNEVRRWLTSDRPVAAADVVARVADLDPFRTLPLDGKPTGVRKLAAEIAREVDRLNGLVARPLPADAPPADRYDRAGVLLALGRPAEAVPLIRDLVAGSPRGRLRLADAYADLKDWPAVVEQCRAAAEAVRPYADRDPKAAAVRRQSLDRLADALAEQDDRPGVEAALRDGAETLPAFAGHFRYRLGLMYQTTGRPAAALAELREAERLDPSLAGPVAAAVRGIREHTPGCLVGR